MRFKKLLLEDSYIEKLERLLSKEKYNLKKPYIWRGRRDREEDVLEKETYGVREPMNTRAYIDYFINEFTKECFPQFPRRRVSRFGATAKHYAENYGTHVYLIVPAKSAKISYMEEDSYSLLDDAALNIRNGRVNIWGNEPENYYDPRGEDRMERIGDLFSEKFVDLLKDIKKAYDRNIMKMDVNIIDYGCPYDIAKGLVENSNNVPNEQKEDKHIKRALEEFAEGFFLLHKYFDEMEAGYPEPNSGEVIYDGEYLQVHEELFEKYKERKMGS